MIMINESYFSPCSCMSWIIDNTPYNYAMDKNSMNQ